MGIDVVGQDFGAFEKIANGEYNEGNVVLVGDRGLSKLNGHHTVTLLNHKTITPQQNANVREALYRAITGDRNLSALSAAQLTTIRERLGLADNGRVENIAEEGAIGNKPLSRREVRQIVSFVKEANLGQVKYRQDIGRFLIKDINAADLSDADKLILNVNLFGAGGQVDQLMDAAGAGLIAHFTSLQIEELAPTADPLKGATKKLAQGVLNGCKKYVVAYAKFAKCARMAAADLMFTQSNVLKKTADGFMAELAKLGNAGRPELRAVVKTYIEQLQAEERTLAFRLETAVTDKLTHMQTSELPPNTDPEQKALDFVRGTMMHFDMTTTRLITQIGLKLATLKSEIVAQEKAVADAQQLKLDTGRATIGSLLDKLDHDLLARTTSLTTLKSTYTALANHPRREERLDGDAIVAKFGEIDQIHNQTLTALKTLHAELDARLPNLTHETVEACRKEVEEKCAKLLADEKAAIDALIAKLNASLKYTVVPLLDEDPAAAAQASEAKRAALTDELEKNWKEAEDEFLRMANTTEMSREAGLVLDCLSAEQKKERLERLEALKSRFSPERHAAYVKAHSIHDPEPKAMLKKAITDLLTLGNNVQIANRAAALKRAQAKLDTVFALVRREEKALGTLDADFAKLSGLDLATLAGGDAERLGALRRALLYFMDNVPHALNKEIAHLKDNLKTGTYLEQALDVLLKKIADEMDKIAALLKNPADVQTAEEKFLANLPDGLEVQNLRAKYIAALEKEGKGRAPEIAAALKADGASAGLKPSLSLTQLKAMGGFFGGVDHDKAVKILTSGVRDLPVVDPRENQRRAQFTLRFDAVPEVASLGEGITDALAEGEAEPPKNVSKLDQVIA